MLVVIQDGVKIDGCGTMNNMQKYAEIMVKYRLNITVEDCHDSNVDQGQGGLWPRKDYCPCTSFRTSNDIQAFAESWFWNLQTVLPFLDPVEPLSQPHCWAYPGENMQQIFIQSSDLHIGLLD